MIKEIREEKRYRDYMTCELTGGFCAAMSMTDFYSTDCRRCNVPVVHTLKELMKCQEQI